MLGKIQGKQLTKYTPDYVLFDLETTGVSTNNDAVVEIAAVKVKGGKVVNEFSSLVNPERPIPFGASRVNGITDNMVVDCRLFREVLSDFFDFIGDNILVGHNIHTFDMKFIYRDSKQYFGKIPTNDYIDTLILAKKYLPEMKNHKLVDMAKYYHISTDGAHRALADCKMNQQVFECLAKDMVLKTGRKFKKCPRCGGLLVKRNGKYGAFLGCSGYPDCRYTENAI